MEVTIGKPEIITIELIKVGKSRKHFFVSLILPRNERKKLPNFCLKGGPNKKIEAFRV